MAEHNIEQTADWNGEQGHRWVEFQRQLDRMKLEKELKKTG